MQSNNHKLDISLLNSPSFWHTVEEAQMTEAQIMRRREGMQKLGKIMLEYITPGCYPLLDGAMRDEEFCKRFAEVRNTYFV